MKKGHKYSLNPVGFAGIVANPKGRTKRKTKRRTHNPKGKAGMFIIRKAKRNPVKPARKAVTKTARKPRRTSRAQAPRPVTKTFQSSVKTMSKTKRRGKRRSRNPSRRGASRRSARSSRRSRNPSPRRSKRRMSRRRNPTQIVGYGRELFSSDMLSVAGGVVLSGVGTTMVLNQCFKTDPTTGKRMFDLPLIDYTPLASPATAGTFYSKNVWPIALYKVIIGGGAAFLLRNQSPRLSRGLAIGTVAGVVSDVLKGTGMLKANGTLALTGNGANANYRAGTGMIPGTNTIYTGPAQRFLTANNVPRPRGTGAAVGPRFVQNTASMVESSFGNAN